MDRLIKARDYLMKCLGFVLLLGFIAIGTVGGCNNDGNGDGTGGVVNRPSINEPKEDGQIVHPADVHMKTPDFSSSDPGLTHDCSDWEIRTVRRNEVVWEITCIGGVEKVHSHLGDSVTVQLMNGTEETLPSGKVENNTKGTSVDCAGNEAITDSLPLSVLVCASANSSIPSFTNGKFMSMLVALRGRTIF